MEHSDTKILNSKNKKELIDIILEVDFENYLLRKQVKELIIKKKEYDNYMKENKELINKLREKGYKI